MAPCKVRPVISKNSSTLSKFPESEQSGSTTGNTDWRSDPIHRAVHHTFTCPHPVDVAAKRVDLTVVGHEPSLAGPDPSLGMYWSKNVSGPSPGGWYSPGRSDRGNSPSTATCAASLYRSSPGSTMNRYRTCSPAPWPGHCANDDWPAFESDKAFVQTQRDQQQTLAPINNCSI